MRRKIDTNVCFGVACISQGPADDKMVIINAEKLSRIFLYSCIARARIMSVPDDPWPQILPSNRLPAISRPVIQIVHPKVGKSQCAC